MPLQTFTRRSLIAGEVARAWLERPASLLSAAYLILALPLLGVRSADAGWSWTVAEHLGALALLIWSVRSAEWSDDWRWTDWRAVIGDWAPLALAPFFYAEVPKIALGTGYHDASIQAVDAFAFRSQPAHVLAGALPFTWLSETLHAAYFSYYALIFLPPALLYFSGRRREFAATQLAIMEAFVACYVAFLIWPVEGPRYEWAAPLGIPGGPIREFVLGLLRAGSARGTAFPSSHAAVSVAASVSALRFQRPVGVVVTALTALLLVGAVYGGFHYATDMIVGAAVGFAIARVVVMRRGDAGRV